MLIQWIISVIVKGDWYEFERDTFKTMRMRVLDNVEIEVVFLTAIFSIDDQSEVIHKHSGSVVFREGVSQWIKSVIVKGD